MCNPETARFARRQQCRLEDRSVLGFITALFEALPFDEKLHQGTKNTFRSQRNFAKAGDSFQEV